MKAVTRVKIRIYAQMIPQYLLVLAVLILTAWLCDKPIETGAFAVSFLVLRYRADDILHCRTTLKCMLLTNGIALVFIPITIPLTRSVFGGLISGFVVNWIAGLVASLYARKKEQKELKRLQAELSNQDIYSLTETELRRLCKCKLFDEIDTEIVVQRLIHHCKGKELYAKIGYSKAQMIRREHRIQKILGIRLK